MPLSPGDKLGPYEILAPIGAGGMGEVYKARDTRLDRIVAIKRLKGPHTARFEQEARAIAALNHPHICQIHDVGPDYLVMEFIDGAPVRGPMPSKEAVRLAIQIAGALEDAHARGFLHRDLKPANILVTNKGAKLLDFGLAKSIAAADATQTIEGAVLGTPAYMSPEQVEGKPADTRSDIFSFGAVLYEMLSGGRAFDGLASVLRDEPARLDSPVAEIVKRCLAKQPSQRFQNMTELRTALEKEPASKLAEQQPSIAVLPFANMSLDKEQEFFSDGLAEEILNLLAKIPSLKVIARTSSFAFRGKEQDIRKIAEALDVKTILEGSVRRSGSRIRVTAQLINSADGSHLWSERYDRQLSDVFEVQDEIAAAIAGALKLKFAAQPAAAERYKPNPQAYEAYLKGRHHIHLMTPESVARGKEYFEQAVSLDSKFADPYAALALHWFMRSFGPGLPQEAMAQVQAWAQKALEIDPSQQDAHACLAVKAYTFDYDWQEAERRLAIALTREPVTAWACFVYAVYVIALGRAGEAEERMRRVVKADPVTPTNRRYMGMILMAAHRYEEAEQEYRHTLELNEKLSRAWQDLGGLHFVRGEAAEALHCFEKVYSLNPLYPENLGSLAGMLARTGNQRRADGLLSELGPPETSGVPFARANYHLYKGEVENAVGWLEKAIDQRYPQAIVLPRLGVGEALRSSPRWPALAKKMNLPESAW